MRRDIAVEETLPYPVETVWQALTDPEALADWVMPVEGFAPVVGQRFRFKARPMPGWDGVINCEVLAVEPPERLVLRWQGSRMRTPTTLTWTLTPTGTGTRLRIDHQGFEGPGGVLLALMTRPGWRRMSRRLGDQLRAQQAPQYGPARRQTRPGLDHGPARAQLLYRFGYLSSVYVMR